MAEKEIMILPKQVIIVYDQMGKYRLAVQSEDKRQIVLLGCLAKIYQDDGGCFTLNPREIQISFQPINARPNATMQDMLEGYENPQKAFDNRNFVVLHPQLIKCEAFKEDYEDFQPTLDLFENLKGLVLNAVDNLVWDVDCKDVPLSVSEWLKLDDELCYQQYGFLPRAEETAAEKQGGIL